MNNPEDHIVLCAPNAPVGEQLFSVGRSLKKKLSRALIVGDRVMVQAFKVTGRPRDFSKCRNDGLVQIMPRLEAKKVGSDASAAVNWSIVHVQIEVLSRRDKLEEEPVILVNVWEHRYRHEAERLRLQLGRDVGKSALTRRHVMRAIFLNEGLQVRHTFVPYATNTHRAVGEIIDYGPIGAIKGTDAASMQITVRRRKQTEEQREAKKRGTPKHICETNFMAIRVARLRPLPVGIVVGSGFFCAPGFNQVRCSKMTGMALRL